jgi:hypothetical protein
MMVLAHHVTLIVRHAPEQQLHALAAIVDTSYKLTPAYSASILAYLVKLHHQHALHVMTKAMAVH